MSMTDPSEADVVKMFVSAVQVVFAALESPASLGDENGLLTLHGRLAALQFAATQLPHEHIDANDIAVASESKTLDRESLANVLPISYSVFDDEGERDERTLADDLGDMYDDLAQGLALHDAGYAADAVWQWRIGYFTVWGDKLAQAQLAIFERLSEMYAAANEDAASKN